MKAFLRDYCTVYYEGDSQCNNINNIVLIGDPVKISVQSGIHGAVLLLSYGLCSISTTIVTIGLSFLSYGKMMKMSVYPEKNYQTCYNPNMACQFYKYI